MKRIFASLLLFSLFFLPAISEGQILTPQDDGLVPEPMRHKNHNQVFPYPYLREADMMWSVRHWERIDLREKMNHHLYYPVVPLPDRKSLFDVLVDGITNEGTIIEVFADDRFEIPLTPEQVTGYIKRLDTIRDPDNFNNILAIDTNTIYSKDIIAYEIKSDWFFDKQRGEMKNRIIGLSPVVKDPKDDNIYNLFWVWFPDARYALATNVAFNNHNNSARLTYDQIFHVRFFNSVIYKEDNVFDREIKDYKRNSTMNQLLESQEIKENLRNFEHDLWEY